MTSPSIIRPDPCADLRLCTGSEARAPGTFEVLAQTPAGDARSARLWTRHGPVETPCFMPVGTYGAVKGVAPQDLRDVGSQIVLANAYHLTHRPGAERIRRAGGLHGWMGYDGPVLTDSGGYQVFSLRSLQRIDDGGVEYRTHFDGSYHRMTPRSVLQVQAALGSDVCMILDHCPPGDASDAALRDAMDRTARWAGEAAELRHEVLEDGQLCFGIVQGGVDLALRREHVDQISELAFDGLALGGLSVGEPLPEMHATIAAVAPTMPANKPRYVMGIGTPRDLLVAVRAGVDLFDCVIPSRHARNGQVFTFDGTLNLRLARFRDDDSPIDAGCACLACASFSRAYLRHLHEQRDPLYVRLATIHNLYFFHQWVAVMRRAIHGGHFQLTASRLQAALNGEAGEPTAPSSPSSP